MLPVLLLNYLLKLHESRNANDSIRWLKSGWDIPESLPVWGINLLLRCGPFVLFSVDAYGDFHPNTKCNLGSWSFFETGIGVKRQLAKVTFYIIAPSFVLPVAMLKDYWIYGPKMFLFSISGTGNSVHLSSKYTILNVWWFLCRKTFMKCRTHIFCWQLPLPKAMIAVIISVFAVDIYS